MILATHGIVANSGITYDTDALAFFTATGITDTTQKIAVNTLVFDLKSAGVWTKMKAIYPFVGGTATTHKFNLKDPRDLAAAFRLDYYGSPTHSSNGIQFGSGNAYVNTNLLASTHLSLNSCHISVYSRTNNTATAIDFGAYSLSSQGSIYADLKLNDGKSYFRINRDTSTSESNIFMSTSALFYLMNRTVSTTEVLYLNNNKNTFLYNSLSVPSLNIYLGAVNYDGVPQYYTNREFAFMTIGSGLTDTECSALYTSVNKYQTTLSRNI
jgi:hypothetical protein